MHRILLLILSSGPMIAEAASRVLDARQPEGSCHPLLQAGGKQAAKNSLQPNL